ncbi:MAG: DUF1624 domain-containing protein [Oscillospiraceae bacterium]|nr:DUF1624 domain-containing protein [Oscillospiraceae bacterium]
MKQRIWELDAARGICLLFMLYGHIVYDVVYLFALAPLNDGGIFDWAVIHIGPTFIIISGICATLGKHPVKRGLLVFGCGMLVSLVTTGMYLLGFADKGLVIYFGVLHCIGICMLLYPLFGKLPYWVLLPVGLAIVFAQELVQGIHPDTFLLLPFGIYPLSFATSDYFPLIPCLGYFLIGSGLGQLLYKNKKSLLPAPKFFPFSTLGFLGRHSLLIYLVHQPIIAACVYVVSLFV